MDSADKVDVYPKVGHVTVATDLPCSYSPMTEFHTNILSLVGRKRLADHEERGKAAVTPMSGREWVTISALATVEEPSILHCCWEGEEGNEKQMGSPSHFFW